MTTRWSAILGACLALAAPARGDDPADARDTPERRLESMRATMKTYDLAREGDRPAAITLREEPAFRIGRQKSNFIDGAIFLWLDEVGRPEAAMQPFLMTEADAPNGKWLHEFTSLSTGPLVASRGGRAIWHPAGPGVVFKPMPGAPKPAKTPALRLAQMRTIAADFQADDNFGDVGWGALRRLTTPIARYGKAGALPEDGALFAFVEGSDPEVFLFIEARPGPDGPEWHYALAPMTCWALKVKLKGRPAWELPRRATGDPAGTLFDHQFWPRTETGR